MKLALRRTAYTLNSTIGELSVDGVFECYTLEDMVRNNGVKVYGETAIDPGTYAVELTRSPRFKRILPLLIDVKNFTGVRIHPGNSAKDTEGCILVGRVKGIDWIGQSVVAFDKLFAKLDNAIKCGETITLEIT